MQRRKRILPPILAYILTLAMLMSSVGLDATVFANTSASGIVRPAQSDEADNPPDLFLPLIGLGGAETQARALPVGGFQVFGPQDYIRTGGPPNLFTVPFAIQHPPGIYTLQIYNGGAGSDYEQIYDPIASAVISVNGTQVAGPSDFNRNVTLIEKAVTLQAQNTLVVELGSGPGSGLTIQIVGIDTDLPTIDAAIDPPANANGWHSGDVTVTFACADATSGIAACTEPVTVTGEGADQVITGTAEDSAGNVATTSVSINLDRTAPDLNAAVDPPANLNGWHNGDVTVTFAASDALSGVDTVTAPVPVTTEGADQAITGDASDRAGNTASTAVTVDLDRTAPTITNLHPANGSTVEALRPVLSAAFADALSGVDPAAVQITLDGVDVTGDAAVTEIGFALTPAADLAQGSHALSITVADGAGNSTTAASTFTVQVIDEDLPPDPAAVASPVDAGVPTSLGPSTEFLYSGENPIQTGVASDTIEVRRAAILRGRVLDRSDAPLRGVTVTVHSRPEYGQTLSRVDGFFDLAVNGGETLIVNYEKEGFLPAQRAVNVPWQDYAFLPDVVLIPVDPQVTTIDLSATEAIQVARGGMESDADGSRQATLLFAQGTTAEMVLPDGTTQPLTTLNVRATEYTVGENGPEAMPAQLPPESAYTYAVELSVDEAMAAGATEVRFSQPVIFYLENFLDFPAGGIVPVGHYDRTQGKWIALENGQIVQIIGITDGLADVDTDGDGVADDGAALGITQAERTQLAQLYTPGQSLWRAPMPHFSPKDLNWAFGLPSDAQTHEQACGAACEPQQEEPEDDPCESLGSIIECQSQTLREQIAIQGTPVSLNYASDRVLGRRSGHVLEIPISAATVPSSLKRIELEIQIAGQRIVEAFPAAPNQHYTFVWDGRDAYGRAVQGTIQASIQIRYVYGMVFRGPAEVLASFGLPSTVDEIIRFFGRVDVPMVSRYTVDIRQWDARSQGLGGWSLSPHHIYDPRSQLLYHGDGTRRSATTLFGAGLQSSIIDSIVGNGTAGFAGFDGPAKQAQLDTPYAVTMAPDGTIYIAEDSISFSRGLIRHIDADGILRLVAGGGNSLASGIPATQAKLRARDIAFGPDGALYIADGFNHCIRRLADGMITTVAGVCGQSGFSGDGGPAAQARLNFPANLAIAADGTIYVSDSQNHRIRRIGTDGIILTVAGNGTPGFSGEGVPAAQAHLRFPRGLAIGPDGSLYVADFQNHRIRRIGIDGIIRTVAGSGTIGYSGDDGPAIEAKLNGPTDVAVDQRGGIYITDSNNFRVRFVAPNGRISRLAGTGFINFFGDGGPALKAFMRPAHGVTVGLDGAIYIADTFNHAIRRLAGPMPSFLDSAVTIPSQDGEELYRFDIVGRHLQTLNARTGAVRYEFGYDDAGRLITITDGDDNVTTIERDGNGSPTAIVGPFGQRTVLQLGNDGYLARLTDEVQQSHHFTYHSGGLLATLTTPRNHQYTFQYDDLGRLLQDNDPAGGFTALERSEGFGPPTITARTALNRTTTYRVESLPNGDSLRTTTDPGGAVTAALTRPDGSQQLTNADGSVVTLSHQPDPRWGLTALTVPASTTRMPNGLTHTGVSQRTVTMADPNDPLSLQSMTDLYTVNGRTYTEFYDAATRTVTRTSPEGHQTISGLDEQGRVVQSQRDPALTPTVSTYDEHGRLARVETGDHVTVYGYDERGRVASVADAVGDAIHFEYDAADRMTQKSLPSGRTFTYTYDANDNLASVTLPSGRVHELNYTPVDRTAGYTAAGRTTGEARSYDLERSLDLVTLPGGRQQDYVRDDGGRLSAIDYAEAQIDVSYVGATERPHTVTRTPATGPAQALTYAYNGSLVTGVTWNGAANGGFAYTYDNNFFITSLRLNGVTLSVTRDQDGNVTGYGPFTFDRGGPAGAQSQIGDSALTISLAYDDLVRLDNRSHTVGGQSVYAIDLDYESLGQNSQGRIARKTETVASVTHVYTYSYDLDGQLLAVHRDGALVESYTYDADGNRTGTLTESAIYGTDGMLSQLGNVAYQFDADGFLAQRGADTFQYSARGELLRASLGSGEIIAYAYDGLGRRVSRSAASGTVQYLYGDLGDIFRITHVRGADGTLTTLFYDEAGYLFALERDGVRFYVATDQVGTPKIVTDAAGAVVKTLAYDSFGRLVADSDPAFDLVIGYAGGLADPATGLVRFGFRDYDPAAGRWTAHDPVLFDGGQENLYVYVQNDPVNLRDPLGLWCVGGSLYAIVGGGAEICWGDDGFSVCGEIGFGAGGDATINTDRPRRNGSQINAEAAAGCGGSGVKVGINLKDCGEFEGTFGGNLGPLQITPDSLGASLSGKDAKINGTKCSLGGKLAAKICGGTR